MQIKLFVKVLIIFLLFFALQLPLWWTRDVVHERAGFRDQAVNDIAHTQAGEQKLLGPILVVPYRRDWLEHGKDHDGKPIVQERFEESYLTLLPQQLQIDSNLQVELRQRGIFPVPVFHNELKLSGRFAWPEQYGRASRNDETLTWRQPFIAISVSSQRGIKQVTALRWNDVTQDFLPGSGLGDLQQGQGVNAPVALNLQSAEVEFAVALNLAGTQQFSVVPLGGQTQWQLQSNWPHPRFAGGQLPDQRQITDQGFRADWQTSDLATNLANYWQRCSHSGNDSSCEQLWQQQLTVSLFEPVDLYSLSERALKYGFLFLGITFGAFLLFEVLKQLAIHPVQYGMVGLALALFFLLLLSLSEHIAFIWAYVIAAAACIGVIVVYLSAVLRSWLGAFGFGTSLAMLYGALYLMLDSEDFALLIGSGLLFGLLTVAMLLTRKVDWYHLQQRMLGNRDPAGS